MLRTRLWMGSVLIGLTVGVLVLDQHFAPWFPFLFLLLVLLAGVACYELLQLLPQERRPVAWPCYLAVGALLLANWVVHGPVLPEGWSRDPWRWLTGLLAATTLGAFLVEMSRFREPGESVPRIAHTVWIAAYLGLLPSFLAELRWEASHPTVAFALAVFVPKSCDTGAYFAGRMFGKHPMAPVLSPKKTWEGAVGGITLAMLVAVALNRLGPALAGGLPVELAFGVTVGGAGMLGDLAESLIKRDCRHKDASQVVPGFGGVLDVVDAIIFAAPVSYWWMG